MLLNCHSGFKNYCIPKSQSAQINLGESSNVVYWPSLWRSLLQATLEEHSGVFFIPLGARLVNERSQECKRMVADCIKTMLQRLDKEHRTRLFDIVTIWLQERKVRSAWFEDLSRVVSSPEKNILNNSKCVGGKALVHRIIHFNIHPKLNLTLTARKIIIMTK